MHEAEFRELFENYYRIGSLEKAVDALEFVVNSEMLDQSIDHPEGSIMHYMFVRLAEDYVDLLRNYETVFDEASSTSPPGGIGSPLPGKRNGRGPSEWT